MTQERLLELTELITQWGNDRFIVQNSTPFAQSKKTHEEVIELVEACTCVKFYSGGGFHRDGLEELKDAIGDIYVTLVMVCACNETPLRMDLTFVSITSYKKGVLDWICKQVPDLIRDCVEQNTSVRIIARSIVCGLVDLCKEYGLDFVDCVEHAYEQIKDRKGYLRSDGVFVKEE
jgi:NTP pyrophosphatase (non-canonical NTP hydrolase)